MKVVGVTIGCGSRFWLMASFAAREFTRRTGWQAHILTDLSRRQSDAERPHHLKFDLFKFHPDADAICFFDADLVFLEPFCPTDLLGDSGFSAVPDIKTAPCIVADAARAGVRPDRYFNSGFFMIHRDVRHLLIYAGGLVSTLRTPFKDQTHLNAAAHRLGIQIDLLPPRFNHHVDRRHTKTLDGIAGAHVHWLKDVPVGDLGRYYGDDLKTMFWRDGDR